MMPKKVLDLRKFAGLPNYLVFTDDDGINKPYSSWDVVNNSRALLETNMFRRYDVIFSSSKVRDRFYYAIEKAGCVKAHYSMLTAPCVVHIVDVIEPDKFAACCKYAPLTEVDYLLVIHEVAGTFQVRSGLGSEMYGYLSEDLTYVRR